MTVTAGGIGRKEGSADKGKGIMIEAEHGSGQYFSSHIGSGSGYENVGGASVQQEQNDANDFDGLGKLSRNCKLYIYQLIKVILVNLMVMVSGLLSDT